MRSRSAYLSILFCFAVFVTFPVAAKDGIHATVHTAVPAYAVAGSRLEIRWTLADKNSGSPFNAGRVFIRLIGPGGDSTESFAHRGDHSDGHYAAIARIPEGGVGSIEIGVAGTLTDQNGHNKRSDWLLVLANDPIQK